MTSLKSSMKNATEFKIGQHRSTSTEETERIRKLAQEIFERRGREPGHELEDWLEAERRVKKELRRY